MKRNPIAFGMGMILFFMWTGFTMWALAVSFTATNAFDVITNIVYAAITNGIAYGGLHFAMEGN